MTIRLANWVTNAYCIHRSQESFCAQAKSSSSARCPRVLEDTQCGGYKRPGGASQRPVTLGSPGRQAAASCTSSAWLRTELATFRLTTWALPSPPRTARLKSSARTVSPPPSQTRDQSKGGPFPLECCKGLLKLFLRPQGLHAATKERVGCYYVGEGNTPSRGTILNLGWTPHTPGLPRGLFPGTSQN